MRHYCYSAAGNIGDTGCLEEPADKLRQALDLCESRFDLVPELFTAAQRRSGHPGSLHMAPGRCQVEGRGDAEGLWLTRALRSDCNDGHVAPGAKRGVAGSAVSGGGEAVTAELEVVVDAAMAGEDALRVAG